MSKDPIRPTVTQETFQLFIEGVKDYGIFVLSPEGIIQTWNLGAERIKSYRADEVIGKHFSLFYTPEDQARHHPQHELEIAEKEGRYEEEGWRVRKDGTRFWANVIITALYDKDRVLCGYSKVTRDMTERKRDEDRLRMLNESLDRRVQERTLELSAINETLLHEVNERKKVEKELQEAVQVRDDFLSIASHELRTPITPLKLQLQGILVHLRKGTLGSLPPERLEKMADTIDRSVNRLGKLIDNLLDVARINAGKIQLHPENFDVSELIRETCARFLREAKAMGSDIVVEVPPSMMAHVDPIRLEQIVTNLLVNAIKYGNGQPISVSSFLQPEKLVIQVKDQGLGIADEDFLRIFQRFEQVGKSRVSSGLGLGLFITKQIIDAYHGTIELKSEVGKGSTFIVKLPLKILAS